MTLSIARSSSCARPRRASLLRLIGGLYDVWRQRQALAKLDAAALKDIGITRGEAYAESRRAPWDAPTTWRN